MSPTGSSVRPTRALLLDVEGTIAPIEFVKSTLFGYAADRCEEFVAGRAGTPALSRIAEELMELHRQDLAQRAGPPAWSSPVSVAQLAEYVRWLIQKDRKARPLKELQGLMWEEGYENGELVGELYADVGAALRRWRQKRGPVAIFSSGSTRAQQLLLAHSNHGDLRPLVTSYFDTGVGSKVNVESYVAIGAALELSSSSVLFVSDTEAELDAAGSAGMRTACCVRDGDARSHHPVVHDLGDGQRLDRIVEAAMETA